MSSVCVAVEHDGNCTIIGMEPEMSSVRVCGPVVWRDGNCTIIGLEPEMNSMCVAVEHDGNCTIIGMELEMSSVYVWLGSMMETALL